MVQILQYPASQNTDGDAYSGQEGVNIFMFSLDALSPQHCEAGLDEQQRTVRRESAVAAHGQDWIAPLPDGSHSRDNGCAKNGGVSPLYG